MYESVLGQVAYFYIHHLFSEMELLKTVNKSLCHLKMSHKKDNGNGKKNHKMPNIFTAIHS